MRRRGKFSASLGAVFWLLMSMFKTDPPPPPRSEDVRKPQDERPGAPP